MSLLRRTKDQHFDPYRNRIVELEVDRRWLIRYIGALERQLTPEQIDEAVGQANVGLGEPEKWGQSVTPKT